MAELPFPIFDADNHYYESEDAFIRYIDPAMQKRCMQWATINGKKRLLVGGRINRFIPNPTWDPVSKPGALQDYFRGRNTSGTDIKTMFGDLDPLSERPEYQDRDARLKVMDAQDMEAALFFPTLAVGMQASLADDIPAIAAAFTAFNRWILDDWGFDYNNRIFAAPVISLADVDWAVAEVEWAIENGARMVVMVPGPVPLPDGGSTSPAMPEYDPVWARINEAGIAVGIHGGDGGLNDYKARWEPTDDMQAFVASAFGQVTTHDRQIFDTMAAFVCHGLYDRHPNLRIACIENGGMFAPHLVEELKIAYGKMPQAFGKDPVESFAEHVWVSPYYEDDIDLIKETVGVDHLLFGSDYPHAEGLEDPSDFIYDIPGFTEDEARKMMRDNAWELVTPRPASAA
ncbi:MAG: amidohydrolase family protein [Acidimicrobiales bacterium]|nr:amidohydrolase family protein [Acidimicrobiales bacterium]